MVHFFSVPCIIFETTLRTMPAKIFLIIATKIVKRISSFVGNIIYLDCDYVAYRLITVEGSYLNCFFCSKKLSMSTECNLGQYSNLPYFREIMTGHKNQVIDFFGRIFSNL